MVEHEEVVRSNIEIPLHPSTGEFIAVSQS